MHIISKIISARREPTGRSHAEWEDKARCQGGGRSIWSQPEGRIELVSQPGNVDDVSEAGSFIRVEREIATRRPIEGLVRYLRGLR